MEGFRRSWVAVAIALLVVVAACGSADGAPGPGGTDATAGNGAAVSGPAPGGGDGTGAPIAAACEAGTPDCHDTLEPGEAPQIPASGGDTSGLVVGGGLSIADALATDATGVLAVTGFVVADAGGARLCDLLAESLPPQCGGASIELASLDTVDPDSLEEVQGVQWTNEITTVIGEIVDGVLVPDAFST